MLRLTAATVAFAALAALVAGTASSAPSKPVGWSPTKAAAQVQAKVQVPWCGVWRNSKDRYGQPSCVDGRPVTADARAHEPLGVANVVCTGVVAAPSGYRQLRCSWQWDNNGSERGTVLVYVTGPTTFRWKSLA